MGIESEVKVLLVEEIAQAVATELFGEPPGPGSNSLTRGMQLPRIRRAIEAALAQDRAKDQE